MLHSQLLLSNPFLRISILRDALIAAAVNYFASFISGLVIFAVLGYMAAMQHAEVNDVAKEGKRNNLYHNHLQFPIVNHAAKST